MTGFGKVLAFLNVIAGLTMLAWTTSAVTNRLGWVDTKTESGTTPGQITRFKAELDELQKLVVESHNSYGAMSNAVGSAEGVKYYRQAELRKRMNDARGIGPDGQPRESVFRLQKMEAGGTNLTDVSVDPNTLKIIKDANDQNLRGLASLQADFNKESGIIKMILLGKAGKLSTDEELNKVVDSPTAEFDTQVTNLGLEDLRRIHFLISDRIALADLAIVKQKEIRQNLKEQAIYLADKKINWLAELQALEIRAKQLQGRLALFSEKN